MSAASDTLLDNGKDFTIRSSYTEDEIVHKLRRLRDENVLGEIKFVVNDITWTRRISNEMILTFQHYKELGRQWEAAEFFNLKSATIAHVDSVLRSPFNQLFRQISFDTSGQEIHMERRVAISIAFILINGRHGVSITNFEIGQNAMSVLAGGISVAKRNLSFGHIHFSNEEESTEERSVEQLLADSLAGNLTLPLFHFYGCIWIDSTTAMILRSLIGHPSLKALELGLVELGEATTNAVCDLLASPNCILSVLILWKHNPVKEGGTGFDFDRFIQLLPVNISLESLQLFDFAESFDHDSANQLLRNLWKFPKLQCLGLTGNYIGNIVNLANNLTMTTTHNSLRVLDLSENRFDSGRQFMSNEDSTQAMLQLLEVFPVLRSLGNGVEEAFPASVTERLDLNGCSGMLLRGAEVPLSVWAVVMAKVDTYPFLEPSGKESIIYSMLHGPVFAGRGPLNRRKRQYPY